MVTAWLALAPIPAKAATCAWVADSSTPAKNLNGFDAISSTDVWSVGIGFKEPETTFTEHWDGMEWSQVPSVNLADADNALNAVSAVSTDDVWAVGYRNAGGSSEAPNWHPLIEHWDGAAWSVVAAPIPPGPSNALTGVAAVGPDDVWAVGYTKSTSTRSTLIEHWNGTAWTQISAPSPTASAGLTGVSATASGDVWAVGYQRSGDVYEPLTLHLVGSTWAVVPSPMNPVGDRILSGVTIKPAGGTAWAAGYEVAGSSTVPYLQKWNGSEWKRVSLPPTGFNFGFLRAMALRSGRDIWAVGSSYDSAANVFRSLSFHYDGSAWSVVPAPGASNKAELIGVTVASDSGRAWAGGRNGPPGLLITGTCGPVSSTMVTAPRSNESAPTAAIGSRTSAGQMDQARTGTRSVSALAAQTVSAHDVATDAGLSQDTKSRGAVILDYNNDGWPDVFLGRHQRAAGLYRNNHDGTFTEVDIGTFGPVDRHYCDAADVNRDDLLDIFCTVGADRGTMIKQDQLWIQQPDHTFVDQAPTWGVMDVFARGLHSTFVDVNDDGWPDLFVGNSADRPDGLPSPNRLFINDQHGHFVDSPQYGLDSEIDNSCGHAADYNNDGRQDLLVCHFGGMALYRNDPAGLTDVSASAGLDRGATDAVMADMNGDNRLDVAAVQGSRVSVYLQSTSGVFQQKWSASLSAGLGIAAGDVNGDDLPDLYVLRGNKSSNSPDYMYLNGGNATSFSPLDISNTATDIGNAESAVPIDYNRDGLSDFVVENGKNTAPGPVQLISFTPSP